MDVRCNSKNYKEFKKLYNENKQKYPQKILPDNRRVPMVSINLDENVDFPLIMMTNNIGKLQEWTSGYNNVKSFLKYGYVKIRKNCPFKHIPFLKKCSTNNCQFYFIKGLTGDCSINWTGIISAEKLIVD